MGRLVLFKGQIPELTPEQKAEVERWKNIRDEDIDFSDIPELRDDERGKYKRLYENGIVWKKIRVKVIENSAAVNHEGILMGEYSLEGFNFEWDDEKYQLNVKKHGVYFEDAAHIFLDEHAIFYYDELHSDAEDRIKAIGMVENILTVIYTERGEVNRIISARRADKHEKEDYYGQFAVR